MGVLCKDLRWQSIILLRLWNIIEGTILLSQLYSAYLSSLFLFYSLL